MKEGYIKKILKKLVCLGFTDLTEIKRFLEVFEDTSVLGDIYSDLEYIAKKKGCEPDE